MRQGAILKKIKKAARAADLTYEDDELTKHTLVIVEGVRTVVSRGSKLDEQYAEMVYKQLEIVLGKGWWR